MTMAMIILSNGETLSNHAQLAKAMAARPATVRRMVSTERVAGKIDRFEAAWSDATGGDLEAVEFVNLRLLFEDLREALA
jgi:hypothetical protein